MQLRSSLRFWVLLVGGGEKMLARAGSLPGVSQSEGSCALLGPQGGAEVSTQRGGRGPRHPWMEASPGGPGGRVPDSSPRGRVCGGGFRVTHDEEMEEASI